MTRFHFQLAVGGLILLLAALVLALRTDAPIEVTPAAADAIRTLDLRSEPILPLPFAQPQPPGKVALGERLFNERAMSRDGSVACADCHSLERGGADGRRVSIGYKGATGRRNAPSVFNAAFNFAQFWDGRVATLDAQVSGPINNPAEMASNWTEVLQALQRAPGYREAFGAIYADGISAANVADAIATYERTLVTPNARFDRYLRGEYDALTPLEIKGYQRFKALGCASCHQGVNVGGNLYQRFGVVHAPAERAAPGAMVDAGRFEVTGREADRSVFKVPSLRNVALTAPYLHDGSVDDLGDVVSLMGRLQLGRDVSREDREAIVAFLHSLTGRYAGRGLE